MHDRLALNTDEGGGFAAPSADAPNPVDVRNLAATQPRPAPQWLDGCKAWRMAFVG